MVFVVVYLVGDDGQVGSSELERCEILEMGWVGFGIFKVKVRVGEVEIVKFDFQVFGLGNDWLRVFFVVGGNFYSVRYIVKYGVKVSYE